MAASWLMAILYVLLTSIQHSHESFQFMLLHTNDMHSYFEQADVYGTTCTEEQEAKNLCYGGFPRLKTAVNQAIEEAKSQNLSYVFLNAGDTFQGTPYYTLLKWKVVASMIPTLGIDVMSLGNHEFDDGVDSLSEFLNNITIPVVAANLNLTLEPKLELPILTPSKILDIGGKKIGIVGYVLPATKNMSQTGSVIFLDEIPCIQAEARRLKKQEHVDIVIALGHSGFEKDLEIAKAIPEISLVVGGHSHTLLHSPKDEQPSVEPVESEYPTMVVQSNGRKVPVVQAYAHTKYLGKLMVKIDDNGDVLSAVGNTLLLNGSIKQDEEVLQKVLMFKKEINSIASRVEGRSKVFLKAQPAENTMESNIGNVITDSFVDTAAKMYNDSMGWTDAPSAMIQGGGIRASFDTNKNRGVITYGDVLTIMPFKNNLYKVRIKGHTLLKALEHSAEMMTPTDNKTFWGQFMQLSGIRITYDFSKPAGHKIKSLYVRCGNCSVPAYYPLNHNKTYSVIVSDYVLNGGDGYDMIKNEKLGDEPLGISDTDAFADYINKSQIIYPGIEGRIIVENSSSSILVAPSILVSLCFLVLALLL